MKLTTVFSAVLFLCMFVTCIGYSSQRLNTWTIRKKNHKPKTLTDDELKSLASLSDPQHFKEVHLKPMLIERVAGTTGNQLVQQHIKTTMRSYGWTIQEDQFVADTPYGETSFNNIIAVQNPAASRRLVLACHFDSKYFTHIQFIGATDSAVPCAMLFDVARSLNSTLWKPRTSRKAESISLQFIFFDGEEAFVQWSATDSVYGARHLAQKMAQNYRQVDRETTVSEIETMDLMVLLDLIGTKHVNFQDFFPGTSHFFSRMARTERRLAKANKLFVPQEEVDTFDPTINRYFISNKLFTGASVGDDHVPFMNRGVSVLHLIAYPFPDVWHKATDNEAALDYNTIDNLNQIIRVFVTEFLHLSV